MNVAILVLAICSGNYVTGQVLMSSSASNCIIQVGIWPIFLDYKRTTEIFNKFKTNPMLGWSSYWKWQQSSVIKQRSIEASPIRKRLGIVGPELSTTTPATIRSAISLWTFWWRKFAEHRPRSKIPVYLLRMRISNRQNLFINIFMRKTKIKLTNKLASIASFKFAELFRTFVFGFL